MQIRRVAPSTPVSISYLSYQVAVPGAEPNNILEEIVWHKEIEVEKMREKVPLRELQKQALTAAPTRDFVGALKQGKTKPALIAEVKKASPSKGVLREDFDPIAIALAYQQGGASCLSVLTDEKFFQGSFDNLAKVRSVVDLPLLCKEFIIYPYQMYLARIRGADAVLLIAAILSDQDLQYFVKIANSLKMAALIEVHSLAELDRVLALDGITLVGINNRNLEDFSVNLQTTCELLATRGQQLQERNILVVSESGLHTAEDLNLVSTAGASAVLIGESLVKQVDPQLAITNLFAKSL
ncbi:MULTISPECIES: indole-3-glycerol phosphate synthase TrpC [Calothrix]|uniref:Indole-3-glycerol phosphate synthase n=2 Tax=Calothrix TaxID=1186 RepID=A0ABR8AHU2_9CYAN|nr:MULTISPECIES: indole-3-glycerol phosphate synthase TrpC [Calothrix]BAY64080.1 indole-3-glycerol phosphate synthase [Calothrix brevissima NIES-22]MBD2199324.1 indole-3-glycerol phosphate synthase TrpC [Calothrix parietina FACHB-288]MBD2204909.1 indole-3-glycerol phosphate synthase TrpC [Calothrix sp. FACHB-168]MBD2216266.1 indole-3-glycerol phosphate synthase TrpC [Calothrix sp. FACHB-1219]MBD2229419.1 indole-3-glycerol phosphate synthase TrpC [Calothrix anomala FACHB-343]